MEEEINQITEKIIGCAFAVSNSLGSGFLEKIYENAVLIELRAAGLKVESQKPIKVQYKGEIIGEYLADLLVENLVIVELKAVKAIDPNHVAQALNYLKATGLKFALILNFGKPKVEIKRIVRSNDERET
jgi:GxxExxY protein